MHFSITALFLVHEFFFSKLGGHLEAEKHHVILKYLQGVTSLISMGVHLEVFWYALRGLSAFLGLFTY